MFTGLLLFLFYTAFFLFILYRLSLRKTFALYYSEAALAFTIKIAAGCFYGYFFLHYNGGDDTWLYHNEALKEYALLKNDTLHFFTNDIIPKGYNSNPLLTVFNSNDSYAKDLELVLLFKLLALFDVFSGGNYYINTIFYNAIVFFGAYFLFKMMSAKYPDKRKWWLLFIFYFPPLLFWTSGIRKDGLCFALTSGLIFQLYSLFEIKFSVKKVFYATALFIVLFLFRNYIALSFLPVIIAYPVSVKNKKQSLLIFAITLIGCTTLFFLTIFLPSNFNLPLKMSERQQAFSQLTGNSYLSLDTSHVGIRSYINVSAQALNHVFIRPYFSEAKGLLYLLYFFEVIFFFILLLRTIIKPSPQFKTIMHEPLIAAFLTIALLNYIIIGFTVPFLGAIVRYKASFEIFFLIVFLCLQKPPFINTKQKTSALLET